jgi:transposase-like protein
VPRAYPTEFRTRAIALVRAGKPAKQTAFELGIHPVTLWKWLRQDNIDHRLRQGKPSAESAELCAARRRIRELETELAIICHAAKFFGGGRIWTKKRFYPVIDSLVAAGAPVD